jgi:hypothetical protein
MSADTKRYHVEVDWSSVVPLGDSLGMRTGGGFDERWVKAFQVVRDEHQLRTNGADWGAIDDEHRAGPQPDFILYVRQINPEAQSFELRRTVNDLVKAANMVAQIGTHVYDLASELRGTQANQPDQADQASGGHSSAPPPAREPAVDEQHADAA